jgi:hypothetical protein
MTTPNRAALSILGLYEWDDTILDLIHLPTGVDADEVKQNILMECAELTVIYPDWDFMHKAIDWWSRKELPTWEHIYEMTQLEYNPIENYDRYETELEMEKLRDIREHQSASKTKSQSMQQSGDANKVAGFNNNDLAVQSGSSGSGASSTTADGAANDSQRGDSNRDKNRSSRIHGNIGVTTVAQMMEGELETYPKINIVQYITQAFKERFCILVY